MTALKYCIKSWVQIHNCVVDFTPKNDMNSTQDLIILWSSLIRWQWKKLLR